MHTLFDRPLDASHHIAHHTLSAAVQHLGRVEQRGDAAVASRAGGARAERDACAVRAVSILIIRASPRDQRSPRCALQVRMVDIDAGVDDGNAYSRSVIPQIHDLRACTIGRAESIKARTGRSMILHDLGILSRFLRPLASRACAPEGQAVL